MERNSRFRLLMNQRPDGSGDAAISRQFREVEVVKMRTTKSGRAQDSVML
jgi:hypothetical protein